MTAVRTLKYCRECPSISGYRGLRISADNAPIIGRADNQISLCLGTRIILSFLRQMYTPGGGLEIPASNWSRLIVSWPIIGYSLYRSER